MKATNPREPTNNLRYITREKRKYIIDENFRYVKVLQQQFIHPDKTTEWLDLDVIELE